MAYKTGETPQKDDEILGKHEGAGARGRVMAVLADDQVRISRRAAYAGAGEPLQVEFLDLPASDFSLIYRPKPKTPFKAKTKAKAAAAKDSSASEAPKK